MTTSKFIKTTTLAALLLAGGSPLLRADNENYNYQNVIGWDFSGLSLVSSEWICTNASNAIFTNAILTDALFLSCNLSGAEFAGAVIHGADEGTFFSDVTDFTKEQLYSTKSWIDGNLQNVYFYTMDLGDWNFGGQNLTGARFWDVTLTGASFAGAVVSGAEFDDAGFTKEQLYTTKSWIDGDLQNIRLYSMDLDDCDFSGQNLTGASFYDSSLTGANFTGAIVFGTDFEDTDFTEDQLYSTKSWQDKLLGGISLTNMDLEGWDFRGQDLTGAAFWDSTLMDAKFDDAIVFGVDFDYSDLTKEQLYSTKSWQDKLLGSMWLSNMDLDGWDFEGQDLTGATFWDSALAGAKFDGAIIFGADFSDTDFTKDQLYSTKSWQDGVLGGISLSDFDLDGWNFVGQDLTGADFWGATLAGASFDGAVVFGADFGRTDLTKEQLYSTKSWQDKTLGDIGLIYMDLSDWDFSGQDMAGANLYGATLAGTNFTGANLMEANFYSATLTGADFTSADLRGANLTNSVGAYITKNTIGVDGVVITNGAAGTMLASDSDFLHVRANPSSGENAVLAVDSTVTGGAGIIVDAGGVLEVAMGATLSMSGAETYIVFGIAQNLDHGMLLVNGAFSLDSDIKLSIVLDNGAAFADETFLTFIDAAAGSIGEAFDEAQISITYADGTAYLGAWSIDQSANHFGIRFAATPIPEPSTWLLLGTGAAVVTLFRRRRGN